MCCNLAMSGASSCFYRQLLGILFKFVVIVMAQNGSFKQQDLELSCGCPCWRWNGYFLLNCNPQKYDSEFGTILGKGGSGVFICLLSMVHFWLTRTFARGQAVLGCIKVRVNQKRRDDTGPRATRTTMFGLCLGIKFKVVNHFWRQIQKSSFFQSAECMPPTW